MTLNVFDRGIDFSDAKIASGDVKKNGGAFIIRYSAGAASATSHPSHSAVAHKLCGVDEIKNAVAAGIDFIANSEWTTSRVLQGYNAGHEDGLADLAFWKSRGLNQGAAVYYSWDEGQPDSSKHNALAEYFRGVGDAFAGYYKRGLYAGDVAINAMFVAGRIEYGWIAMSSSWSKPLTFPYKPGSGWKSAAQSLAPKTKASLWQNGNTWFNNGADEDVVLRTPVGSHLEGNATPPTTTPVTNPTTPSTHPAPGPAVAFPLPSGYYFGPKDGPTKSVSGYFNRSFNGHTDKYWLELWATQVSKRGWSVGKGKTYLHIYGNNGEYGPEYEGLIKAFQKDQHLSQDGELGVLTWNAAYHNPVT